MRNKTQIGIIILLFISVLLTWENRGFAQNEPTPTLFPIPTPILETEPLSVPDILITLSPTPFVTPNISITLTTSPPVTVVPNPTIMNPEPTSTINSILNVEVATPTSIFTNTQPLILTPMALTTKIERLQSKVISLEQVKLLLSLLILTLSILATILLLSNIRLKKKLSIIRKNQSKINQKRTPKQNHYRTPIRADPKDKIPKQQVGVDANEWILVGASVIGKDHIKLGLPCQDSFHYSLIGNDWGIAVVADGAGSATNSHMGSAFVAREAARRYFGELVVQKGWHTRNKLPSRSEWTKLAKIKWEETRGALEIYAQHNNIKSRSLACTAIVVIFSPSGILVTHIGDGRAGYRNAQKEWKPLIIPHKGEEANSTIFLTSINWNDGLDEFIESRVISEPITAFALMSDGCEKHAFECGNMDSNNKWSDPNRPYPRFFEPLVSTLLDMKSKNTSNEDMLKKWEVFLTSGHDGLVNEPDDKTLVLGILDHHTISQ